MDAPALLARVRGRLRRTVALGGTARLVAVLLAGVGAAVLADRFLFLPGWLRLILLLALAGMAAAVAWRRLIRPLRTPLSDRDLASFVERRVPALEGRLLTAVDGIALDDSERGLLSAALPSGAERSLVPASRLPRTLAVAGGALAAALAVSVVAPSFWRDGLTRLALPLAAHDWERSTAFRIAPERAVVAIDEPAVIAIERVRGADGPARISWSDGAGSASARQLPGTSGPWRTTVPLAAGRWTITVAGGDAHAESTTVLVVPRPRLDGAATTLTPPAYSHLPVQQLASPACQALQGSTLAFSLTISAPPGRTVAQVEARLGDQVVPLTRDGAAWRGTTAIAASAELAITASDPDGIALHPAARFPIAVEPDRAPTVSLAGPRGDEAVGPRAKVAVTIEAGDDLGLARLGLAATPSGAPAAAQPRQLVDEQLDGRRAITQRALIDVAALAGPGATITLVGRAEDANDVSGPGVGTSAPLVLKVVAEDELRRDLERQLGEARDRVHQARGNLAPGLADPAKLPTAARSAGQDAARAAELLARIERRWAENGLEPERIAPAAEARAAAGAEAGPPLAQAAAGDEQAAHAGDAALDKAERALDRMLSDSDLTRIIAMLIEREQALLAETRPFVREHLTKQPDDAGRTRQADLAARQKDLATRAGDAERRILSGPAALDAAKAIVREQTPADRMAAASGDIASPDHRPRAPDAQQAAITALTRILEALRGGDQLADLARRAGELAERQERLAEAIERGMPKDEAVREQERLRQETERLAKDLERKPDAQKSAAAAANAQQGAQSAMAGGDRGTAARDAGTAGELLRAAQRALDPKQDQQKDKPEKSSPDVIALLRKLFDEQARVLADSLPIDKRIGEDEPDFAAKRDLAVVAQQQDDILLQLREEGVKALDQQPIALAAVQRVEAAMDKVLVHLRKPALGSRGLALERIALAELKRVIDIAASIQTASEEGGGGGGGGGGNQAPFPPAAELALLVARQAEIHAQAAAGRPVDTGAMQLELTKLITLVEGATKPGSRPNVLMGRARRAAESATTLLANHDRGATARHNMLASEEALRQILAEAKGSGGGGGGGGGGGQSAPPTAGGGQPKPGGAQPGQPGQPGGGAAAGAGATAAGNGQAGTDVRTEQEATALLQLPPERREQLRQAREQHLPAGALQLFERYLEKLEER